MRDEEFTYKERRYWEAGVDLKRFTLCVRKKIWAVAAAALAGALFAGALYLVVRQLSLGETQYRAEVLFAIRYNIQEEDETLKAFINEYNAYTWGDVMRSDRVVPAVLEEVPELSRAQAEACLDTAIASDPEFLSAGFTTDSPELSERVRDAYIHAMAAFGETMADRGLTAIEAWKVSPAEPVSVPNRVLYAMELGAVLGLLAGGLVLAGRYVLDDSVLLGEDVKRYYSCPVLGYRTKRPHAFWDGLLSANLSRLAEQGPFAEVALEEVLALCRASGRPDSAPRETAPKGQPAADFVRLRQAPAVLQIPWGTPCLRCLGPVLETLKLQGVPVRGCIIAGADGRFLDAYYGPNSRDSAPEGRGNKS